MHMMMFLLNNAISHHEKSIHKLLDTQHYSHSQNNYHLANHKFLWVHNTFDFSCLESIDIFINFKRFRMFLVVSAFWGAL